MTEQQYIDFLEPQFEVDDPKTGKVITPARAGALCMSAVDWNNQKTSLEQACTILGTQCTEQAKQQIASFSSHLTALQSKSKAKKSLATQFKNLKIDPTSK